MTKKKLKSRSKSKAPAAPRIDPYIDGLMSKLLERLVSLENKIDRMLAQSPKNFQNHEVKHSLPQQPQQPPRRDRVLYEAICADCSKVCEVPFKPSEDRAVYCKECFARRKSGGNGMPKLTPVAMPSKSFQKPVAVAEPPVKKIKKAKKKR